MKHAWQRKPQNAKVATERERERERERAAVQTQRGTKDAVGTVSHTEQKLAQSQITAMQNQLETSKVL